MKLTSTWPVQLLYSIKGCESVVRTIASNHRRIALTFKQRRRQAPNYFPRWCAAPQCYKREPETYSKMILTFNVVYQPAKVFQHPLLHHVRVPLKNCSPYISAQKWWRLSPVGALRYQAFKTIIFNPPQENEPGCQPSAAKISMIMTQLELMINFAKLSHKKSWDSHSPTHQIWIQVTGKTNAKRKIFKNKQVTSLIVTVNTDRNINAPK